MLPGFTRTAPQPASIAWKTYFGLKWMSAITGIRDCWAMIGSASASLSVGQATRNDVAACGRQLGDLLQRRADVVRFRRRHRLDGHRCPAATGTFPTIS